VQRARRRLEAAGQVPAAPYRVTRPPGRRPPLARRAIAVLGPDATPRQVADYAHISVQAAWKALRGLRDRAARLPPELARGTCVTGPEDRRGWWDGTPQQRQAAALVCTARCPVLNACVVWSSYLPASDPGVYGGFTAGQRQRIARAAAVRTPWQAARDREAGAAPQAGGNLAVRGVPWR
jgi:hypothetical protein